jgi:CheY-like chemotaxis protein
MRVLLVDDHELIWNGTRRLLERVLLESGRDVALEFHAVRDLRAALALADAPFELVLLDYHLPGVEGLAALQQV